LTVTVVLNLSESKKKKKKQVARTSKWSPAMELTHSTGEKEIRKGGTATTTNVNLNDPSIREGLGGGGLSVQIHHPTRGKKNSKKKGPRAIYYIESTRKRGEKAVPLGKTEGKETRLVSLHLHGHI